MKDQALVVGRIYYEKPDPVRRASDRKGSQVTCTMSKDEREYLEGLSVRLANKLGEPVPISSALRYLIKWAKETGEWAVVLSDLEE